MKKIITLLLVISVSLANAQAYKGKGDVKAQVGANIQSGGTGIFVSGDFGVGENMSVGFSTNYLLSAKNTYFSYNTTTLAFEENKPKFIDRIDAKARFNVNLGNVIGLDITDSMKLFMSSDLMTLQEACAFLGISESTMRRKIRDGKVKYTKDGKDYRFKKAEIIKLAA